MKTATDYLDEILDTYPVTGCNRLRARRGERRPDSRGTYDEVEQEKRERAKRAAIKRRENALRRIRGED